MDEVVTSALRIDAKPDNWFDRIKDKRGINADVVLISLRIF